MKRNIRATTVSLNLRETPELRAHIAAASPTSTPLLASQPIDNTTEAIPADQREAVKLAADLCGVKTRAVANLVLGEVVSLLSWGQSQETPDNLHTAIALHPRRTRPDQRDSPRESRRSQAASRQLTYAHSGHRRSASRLTSE
jgi:hypothetical protein